VVDSGIESRQKAGAEPNRGSSGCRADSGRIGKRTLAIAGASDGRDGGEAAFILTVPGGGPGVPGGHPGLPARIQREFSWPSGSRPTGRHLVAIVTMDLETAVASIVAAEGSESSAVRGAESTGGVARSFLTAGRGRHADFDFCDTHTLPVSARAPAKEQRRIARRPGTRGQVADLRRARDRRAYSADCGGTHARSRTPAGGVANPASSARILISRWNARCTGDRGSLSGAFSVVGVGTSSGDVPGGRGGMARRGSSFQEILRHYFPATAIVLADRELAGP